MMNCKYEDVCLRLKIHQTISKTDRKRLTKEEICKKCNIFEEEEPKMATIKKCDICGKTYEPYGTKKDSLNPNGFAFVGIQNCGCGYPPSYFTYSISDTCITCRDKIKSFIQELSTEKDGSDDENEQGDE